MHQVSLYEMPIELNEYHFIGVTALMKFNTQDPLEKMVRTMHAILENYKKIVTGEILPEELYMHCRAGGSL